VIIKLDYLIFSRLIIPIFEIEDTSRAKKEQQFLSPTTQVCCSHN